MTENEQATIDESKLIPKELRTPKADIKASRNRIRDDINKRKEKKRKRRAAQEESKGGPKTVPINLGQRGVGGSIMPNGLVGRWAIPLDEIFMAPLEGGSWEDEKYGGVDYEPFWKVANHNQGSFAYGLVIQRPTTFSFRPTPLPIVSGMRSIKVCLEYGAEVPGGLSEDERNAMGDPVVHFALGYLTKDGKTKIIQGNMLNVKGYDVHKINVPLNDLTPGRLFRCRLEIDLPSQHHLLLSGASLVLEIDK